MNCSMLRRFLSNHRAMFAVRRHVIRSKSTQTPRLQPYKEPRSFDGHFFLVVCPLTCVVLGVWQTRRLKWKEGLIAELKSKGEQPPLPLPQNLKETENMDLVKVTATGRFDYANEIFIGPKSDYLKKFGSDKYDTMSNQSGLYVVTPFQLSGRPEKILVNRGWYSNNQFADREYRMKGREITEEVEVVGNIRLEQEGNLFTYFTANDNPGQMHHGEEIYLMRKLGQFSERCGTEPVYIDAKNTRLIAEAPQPVGDQAIQLRNSHLEYAITWFSLAIVTFVMWGRKYRQVHSWKAGTFLKNQR